MTVAIVAILVVGAFGTVVGVVAMTRARYYAEYMRKREASVKAELRAMRGEK